MHVNICRILCHLAGSKDLLLLLSTLFIFYLLHSLHHHTPTPTTTSSSIKAIPAAERHLSLSQILFSIAGSSSSFPLRTPYLRLWYNPNSTNAVVFLDNAYRNHSIPGPPVFVSSDTSRFPYTFPSGKRSAIRVARIVRDTLDLELNSGFDFSGIRWFVFGDDDTLFFVENVARILSKYDDEKWYYIGCNSESYAQNEKHSFDMAFGGGGFAISAPLARVLARVLDSCLVRYPHVYGSDSRIFACLTELGVSLTRELGFHQIDVRGDIFGILSAHPLSLAASLHHLDKVEPIFPNMSRIQAIEHLFKAVYIGNLLLPDLLQMQRTFIPWRKRRVTKVSSSHYYMFNTRKFPSGDPCEMPVIFYLHDVVSQANGSWTSYTRHTNVLSCERNGTLKDLVDVKVFSWRSNFDVGQLKTPRRHCCDISLPVNKTLVIGFRDCGEDELIRMHNT
ncbi:unnamed protein product [Cuscuta europaea]|uniref:Uncharacterized protein n=1 Tax=Cuscuta europaea TaxID=41803 RepID=A0A9P0ZVE0_CUSEU|nr:unnamed protein product [Cuscuta europaea]